VELEAATEARAALLQNLLELYAHDLSGIFDLKVDAEGRFGYPRLPLYWTEPDRRFAFLLRSGTDIAGFALICRGSPISDVPHCHDMAEFFVLRPYRRSGLGAQAAHLLWQHFRGPWTVRVAEGNRGGLAFWTSAISTYTANAYEATSQMVGARAWVHFSFRTPG
jgi:predicted acetyltransferase